MAFVSPLSSPSSFILVCMALSNRRLIIRLNGRTIPSALVTEAGIPREKVRRAFAQCAAQKLKCSGCISCERCILNGFSCQYFLSKRRSRSRPVASGPGRAPTRERKNAPRPNVAAPFRPRVATSVRQSSPSTDMLGSAPQPQQPPTMIRQAMT